LNNNLVDKFHIRVTLAGKKAEDFKTTIFVGNIPFICSEEEIRAFFRNFGKIDYVRVIRDKLTQSTKGFCYVKFASKEDLQKFMKVKRSESVSLTRQGFKRTYPNMNIPFNELLNERGELLFKGRNIRISMAKKSMVKSRKKIRMANKDNRMKKGAQGRISAKERKEMIEEIANISKGVRMGSGGYDIVQMNNVVQNNVVAPRSVVKKRIKKIEKRTDLTRLDKVKMINKVEAANSLKLKEGIIETEGLLAKRRKMKKIKKKMNIRAMRRAQK
jgi:RNA recognition motif-containing protein